MLRHADAEDGSPDAERPLSEKGRRQAEAAGRALAAMDVRIDACVTSPKVRARDTAALACKALGIEPEEDLRLEGGPFDPREVAEDRGEHVLLVGHDPDFSLAVNRLTGAQVRMKKGAVAAIDRGELMVLLRPAELALLAREG
ncbi:MAG TPA: histidine phosphatase family protein [Thermoleophilaceae bacterium]|nr:histidine phosphatase family protein [Thermoleophilaceae bacterium]